jgi:hypothetical protein
MTYMSSSSAPPYLRMEYELFDEPTLVLVATFWDSIPDEAHRHEYESRFSMVAYAQADLQRQSVGSAIRGLRYIETVRFAEGVDYEGKYL